jgi:hypothetical protein
MGKIFFLILISLYSCEGNKDEKITYNHSENEFNVLKVDMLNEEGDTVLFYFGKNSAMSLHLQIMTPLNKCLLIVFPVNINIYLSLILLRLTMKKSLTKN